jgi:hypothetical protein
VIEFEKWAPSVVRSPIQQYDEFFVEDLPFTIAAEVSERIRKM